MHTCLRTHSISAIILHIAPLSFAVFHHHTALSNPRLFAFITNTGNTLVFLFGCSREHDNCSVCSFVHSLVCSFAWLVSSFVRSFVVSFVLWVGSASCCCSKHLIEWLHPIIMMLDLQISYPVLAAACTVQYHIPYCTVPYCVRQYCLRLCPMHSTTHRDSTVP
jgi:hypothetical protein